MRRQARQLKNKLLSDLFNMSIFLSRLAYFYSSSSITDLDSVRFYVYGAKGYRQLKNKLPPDLFNMSIFLSRLNQK